MGHQEMMTSLKFHIDQQGEEMINLTQDHAHRKESSQEKKQDQSKGQISLEEGKRKVMIRVLKIRANNLSVKKEQDQL